MCIPGGQGVAGSNPAVPTGFRTLVPQIGNKTGHDHSHPTGRDEQNIQGGGHVILIIALPRWPRSQRAARSGVCLPTAGADGWDQHAMAEQLAQRRNRRGRSGSPSSTLPAPNPTGHLTSTPDVRLDQHPGEHGALPDPPCGAGANGESAAAEAVMTAAAAARTHADHLPPASSTRSPNVANTRSDAHASRANTRR